MNKFKKIILTVVCIVSALVIASVPSFASTYQFNYARQVGQCDFPSQLQVMTLGYNTNSSQTIFTSGTKTAIEYADFTVKPSGGVKSGQEPRLQFHFYYNSTIPKPRHEWNGSEWVEKLGVDAKDLNTFNNYSSRNTGMLDITFKLYQPHYVFSQEFSLAGFELRSAVPDFNKVDIDTGDIYDKPIDFYSTKYPENVTIGSTTNTGTFHYWNGEKWSTRTGSYVDFRVIVPLTDRLTDFVFTIYTNSLSSEGAYVRDLNMTYYSNPFQLPNYNYVPDIDRTNDLHLLEEDIISQSNTGIGFFKDMLMGVKGILHGTSFFGISLLSCSNLLSLFLELELFKDILHISLVIGAFAFIVNLVPTLTHYTPKDNGNDNKNNKSK